MCATVSNLYNVYNNNYNNNCLLDILLCLQSFYKQQHLFVIVLTQLFAILLTAEIFKPWLFSSHAMHPYTRLTELLLLIIGLVLFFIYDNAFASNCLVWRTFSLSRKLYSDFIVVCRFCSHCLLLYVIVGLLITSSMYVLVSVAFTIQLQIIF